VKRAGSEPKRRAKQIYDRYVVARGKGILASSRVFSAEDKYCWKWSREGKTKGRDDGAKKTTESPEKIAEKQTALLGERV